MFQGQGPSKDQEPRLSSLFSSQWFPSSHKVILNSCGTFYLLRLSHTQSHFMLSTFPRSKWIRFKSLFDHIAYQVNLDNFLNVLPSVSSALLYVKPERPRNLTNLTQPGIGRIKERIRVFASYLRYSTGSPRGNSFFQKDDSSGCLRKNVFKSQGHYVLPAMSENTQESTRPTTSCLKVIGYQSQHQRLLKPRRLKQIPVNVEGDSVPARSCCSVFRTSEFPLVALVKIALVNRFTASASKRAESRGLWVSLH